MSSFASSTQFPPVETANEDGLLMLGGELSVATVLTAYRRGIFPWPLVDGRQELLSWWSPDPRAIIELDQFRVSRRVQRRIRRQEFTVTFDKDFEAVIAACAAPRREDGETWITSDLNAAYNRLHREGFAHSVEVWQDERLVGGVYGIAIGGFFAGESMFHRETDASKVALFHLVGRLSERRFSLFDIQQQSPHLQRMGATEIPRREFLRRLNDAMKSRTTFSSLQE
jgi:leucyl/phenylalanyl-tRNA--protein transferase